MHEPNPIGVFDSGYGGLTILNDLVKSLPEHDFLYLGDNARAPYGNRSFETVYQYTLQCVQWFFKQGCPLVVLACNTASAKALRTIQQKYLTQFYTDRKVLGVIRPTAEVIGNYTQTNEIGILGTPGTIHSESYVIEINKFFPEVTVSQQACPFWVPLVENDEYTSEGAEYFIKKDIEKLLAKSPDIDTILLGCTHYPLLLEKIKKFTPDAIKIISQGEIVAQSLKNYLARHSEIKERCSRNGSVRLFTTDSAEEFDKHSANFFDVPSHAIHVDIDSA